MKRLIAGGFLNAVGVLALVPAAIWPDSTPAALLRYAAMAYILVDLAIKARAGYRRRLPHWTAASWKRYYTVCAVFAAILLVSLSMAAAVDYRLPIAGPRMSTHRSIWAGALIALMLIGGGGLVSAVYWLLEGDPSKQFTRFQRQRA